MEKKYEKFLPLGSVVLLKKAKKRIMITGYCIKTPETPDKMWDYVGCLYPEGMLSSDKNLLFNHDDILQIYAVGYLDDELNRYINVIKQTVNSNEAKN